MASDSFPQVHGDYTVYKIDGLNEDDKEHFVISWKGEWLTGAYDSVEEALAGGGQQVEAPRVRRPKVKGYCPFCGHPDPEVGPDAWLRCTNTECPNPDGVGAVLLDNEIEHIIDVGPSQWMLRHPLRERVGTSLFDCPFNGHMQTHFAFHKVPKPGRYRVTRVDDDKKSKPQWNFEEAT